MSSAGPTPLRVRVAVSVVALVALFAAGMGVRAIAAFSDTVTTEGVVVGAGHWFPPVPASCAGIVFDGDPIVGTSGDDAIDGGNGNDLIFGLGGNDVLEGGNGKDCLVGGDGDDQLYGGNAKDYLLGGDGDDVLHGDNGADVLDGEEGADTCVGGNGPDTVVNCEAAP